MKTLQSILLLCLLIALALTQVQTSIQPNLFQRKVDPGTILFLFQNKIFKSLNTKLQEWQNSFEEDFTQESNVYDAFEVFESSDPLYEAILTSWIGKFGTTYPPYVARAIYYYQRAWDARGHKWASETTEDQFQEMRRFFTLALEDIKSALSINPKLDICYDKMINIGMAIGDDVLKKNALSIALKYNPYGYKVRATFLYSLTPRWGGSYQEMEEFVEESERYVLTNPELKTLRGQIFADKAHVCSSEEDYGRAVQLYTEAIKHRKSANYYADRGDCYYNLDYYKQALDDYETALKIKPNTPNFLRKKSNALYCLKKFSEAQDALEKAAKLDPNSKWIKKGKEFLESDGAKVYNHSSKGIEYFRAQRYQDAITEFTEALLLQGDSPDHYYNRALCYHKLGRYEEALKDYKEVIIRRRDDLNTYKAIVWIEYHLGKYDDALTTSSTIIKLDPNEGEAYYNRALIYIAKGRENDAYTDARRACDLGCQQACPLAERLR